VIANAVHMMRIATGEIEETYVGDPPPKGHRVSVTLKTTKAKKRPAGGRAADAAPVAAQGGG